MECTCSIIKISLRKEAENEKSKFFARWRFDGRAVSHAVWLVTDKPKKPLPCSPFPSLPITENAFR
jgi:hypothetical protein